MKLTGAQLAFLRVLAGRGVVRRRERDGTVMPWRSENRTLVVLIRLGLAKWTEAGKGGYIYNGVVLTDAGRVAAEAIK